MPNHTHVTSNEQLVRVGIVLASVIMAGFGLAEWVVSLSTVSLGASAIFLLWFSHFPRTLDITRRGAVATVFVTVVLGHQIYLSGGVYAAALHALPVIPLFAVLNGPPRLAAGLTAAIFAAIQGLLVLHVAGVELPKSTHPEVELMFGVEATAVAVVLAFLLARLYDRSVRRAEAEREHVYRELRTQQRLASMGTLAAGAAHEINNPLTAVLSNMAYVREELGDLDIDPDVLDAVEDSIEGAARIARIVKQLGLLGEKSESISAESVAAIVKDVVRLTDRATEGVSIVLEIDETLEVMGPSELLRQVFVNLVVNAAQAMIAQSGDPQICIRTGATTDSSVEVIVEDNGPGIAQEHLEAIFDPFFTTKKVWEGQGLGLAVVAQILADAGASVTVENVKPHGARFTVTLPRAVPEKAVPSSPHRYGSHLHGDGRLEILIVDDEPAVIRALQRALRDHDVTATQCGQEAISMLDEHPDFDLVILDLSMPVMNGIELSQTMLDRHPDIAERVVFLTGGAVDADARVFVRETSHTVLYKPVDNEQLSRVLTDAVRVRVH